MNDKFVSKKVFGDHKAQLEDEFTGVKKRLDALEKEQDRIADRLAHSNQAVKNEIEGLKEKISKNTRDIKDLFNISGQSEPRERKII